MTTLLLTAIAGDIAQGVATILRRVYPDWRLVGADIHDQHGGARLVDVYTRLPRAADSAYAQAVRDLLRAHDVSAILPLSEAELAFFAPCDGRRFSGVPLLMANRRAVEVGLDKLATFEVLTAAGLDMPWTRLADPTIIPPLPCFFKARRGAGSKIAFVCADQADAVYLARRYPDGLYQELLDGADREVTCAVFRDATGRIAVLQLQRRLVGGLTGWARVIDVPEIEALCARVAELLDLQGSINIQLRRTERGPRIFEINPRFSSTVLMRHELGFRDVKWTIQAWLGESIECVRPPVGAEVARSQAAVVLDTTN